MPLPLQDCADDISLPDCADAFFTGADRVRCIATDAVVASFTGECRDREFRSYVTVGEVPQDWHADCLIVTMRVGEPTADTSQGDKAFPLVFVSVEYIVELWETGWPTIEVNEAEETIYVPDSDLVNAVARHSYSHGESMFRALFNEVARRTIWRGIDREVGVFTNTRIAGLRPLGPETRTAGWVTGIQARVGLS